MKVSEIVDQNPWWAEGEEFVSHDLHLSWAKPVFFRRRPLEMALGGIYVLRGPRQVGKTTYFKETVKELLKRGVPPRNILYLSVDFFTSRRKLREEPLRKVPGWDRPPGRRGLREERARGPRTTSIARRS